MKITFWGTRGSLPAPGPETPRYGGNTACVEVWGAKGTLLILDAGTGIRRLGRKLPPDLTRIDIVLSHLHLDHIQGLGFFAPLYNPDIETHLWGPASTTLGLRTRLVRYLSPPLFPVHLRDLPNVTLHEMCCEDFSIGEFDIEASLVCHPDSTLGYRITDGQTTLAFIPDHEPALGLRGPFLPGEWTSGYSVARDADVLIHDAQYNSDEYACHIGWGHSSIEQTFAFAELCDVKHLVPFHYDPNHSDSYLDRLYAEAVETYAPSFPVTPAREGESLEIQSKTDC